MKTKHYLASCILALSFMATGCQDKPADATKAPPAKKKKTVSHDHGQGPNGGVIFDLGKYHAEFTVDHAKQECAVFFLDGDDKAAKTLVVAANEFTLTTKPTKTKEGKEVPALTIILKPVDAKEGKAARFTGIDASFGNLAEFEGSISGEIDGKPSSGEFKE